MGLVLILIYDEQTDPNWGNFLYEEGNEASPLGTLHLIDFGAARDFPADFVKDYLEMVKVRDNQGGWE